jgi:hypothetical protein
MMDALDVVIKECDEKVEQLKNHMATGSLKSYEEYKQLCGEIKGLLTIRGYSLDLRRIQESDED